jgi:hypothetical protein
VAMKKVAQEIFTKKKMTDFLVNEMIGRFVGFIIGMWTTSLFSKVVYEKKGLKNLFGLAPRKKVVVNTTPEWLQLLISAIVGFIVLELINYFFKHKLYVPIWEFIKVKWNAVMNKGAVPASPEEINDPDQQELTF